MTFSPHLDIFIKSTEVRYYCYIVLDHSLRRRPSIQMHGKPQPSFIRQKICHLNKKCNINIKYSEDFRAMTIFLGPQEDS